MSTSNHQASLGDQRGVNQHSGLGDQHSGTAPLSGAVAVVTGAARGIGEASARELAQHGARVLLLDRDEIVHEVAEALRDAGAQVSSLCIDVADPAGWAAALALCHTELGTATILVNNAYVQHQSALADTSLESWNTQLAVNLTGPFLATTTFLADLRESRGSIVMVSSVHAHFGLPGRPAYATTKAGITGLARQLAVEYGDQIRVNSVLPGPILTAAWAEIGEADRRAAAAETAVGRLGDPAEVARVIRFLASPEASFLTGAEIPVDGGWSIVKNSS